MAKRCDVAIFVKVGHKHHVRLGTKWEGNVLVFGNTTGRASLSAVFNFTFVVY